MDELSRLRKDVAAQRQALAALTRQPERRQAQVEAVVPLLRRIVVAMGVEESVALRWQEQVIAADDPDARQVASQHLFDQVDSWAEAQKAREDELGDLLARAVEALAAANRRSPS